MKLNLPAFALAFGIWWGGGIFLLTWWLLLTSDAASVPLMLDKLYFGYSVTPLGSLVGLVYGFVCGAVCGGIFAWLYNMLADRIAVSPHGATGHAA